MTQCGSVLVASKRFVAWHFSSSFSLGDLKIARDQIANSSWIIEKARGFQKNIYFCFIDYVKAFDCMDHNKLWKILKDMGIPDHLTCPLRNLYAGQEATVRIGRGTMDWFQIGKGVCQGCTLSPAYLTSMQSTSCEMLGWLKHKLESRLLAEISITSDMQMTPPLWQKAKRTKEHLDESERGEWKNSSAFKKWRSWHLVPSLRGK